MKPQTDFWQRTNVVIAALALATVLVAAALAGNARFASLEERVAGHDRVLQSWPEIRERVVRIETKIDEMKSRVVRK